MVGGVYIILFSSIICYSSLDENNVNMETYYKSDARDTSDHHTINVNLNIPYEKSDAIEGSRRKQMSDYQISDYRGCFIEPDYNYLGFDLGAPVIEADWKACRDSATRDANAHYWTFRFSDRFCWLKLSNRYRIAEGRGILISGEAGCRKDRRRRKLFSQWTKANGQRSPGAGIRKIQTNGRGMLFPQRSKYKYRTSSWAPPIQRGQSQPPPGQPQLQPGQLSEKAFTQLLQGHVIQIKPVIQPKSDQPQPSPGQSQIPPGQPLQDCMEMDTDYFLNDIVPFDQADRIWNWQECSELCRNKYAECKFWTLVGGRCLVKTSKDGKRNLQGSISGSRECGSNAGESVCNKSDWPDIKNGHAGVCAECKVLVNKMKSKYITCNNYCNSLSRYCSGAWDEANNTCKVVSTKTCAYEFTNTTDAICECGSTTSVMPSVCNKSDWPDIKNGHTGVCAECKVLVNKMKSKYITCNNYCNRLGRHCSGAWDESGNTCKVESTKTCAYKFTNTTDAICECSYTTSIMPSAIDGGWSDWGQCSKTCEGGGVKERLCTNPVPTNNGTFCKGNNLLNCNEGLECGVCGFSACSFHEGCPLVKNNILTTLPELSKEFVIYLEYKTMQHSAYGLQNVIHFTEGEGCCKVGSRVPALFVTNSGVENIAFPVNGINDFETYVEGNKPVGSWHHVEISQILKSGKYIFQAKINGKKVIEKENKKPKIFSNVKVYAANNWDKTLNGSLRHLCINTKTKPIDGGWSDWGQCSKTCEGGGVKERRCTNPVPTNNGAFCKGNNLSNCNEDIECFVCRFNACAFHEGCPLVKNNTVITLPELAKEFIIYLEYKTRQYSEYGFQNVIHFTEGEGCCKVGSRVPALFVANCGVLKIAFPVNGINDFETYVEESCRVGRWHSVEISQILKSGKYIFQVKINRKKVIETENKKPKIFFNVKVYAANKWNKTLNGSLRYLCINTKTKEETNYPDNDNGNGNIGCINGNKNLGNVNCNDNGNENKGTFNGNNNIGNANGNVNIGENKNWNNSEGNNNSNVNIGNTNYNKNIRKLSYLKQILSYLKMT